MRNPSPVLSVVMPVYNEADSIETVIDEWLLELDSLQVPYEFIVLDDGSRDGTREVVDRIALRSPALRVLHHANRGHGPTILRGYADTSGDWVLQIDSDGEIPAAGFREVWRRREPSDMLVGRRVSRTPNVVRQIVSAVSRMSVRLLFGRGIHDVNVPYRLIRGPLLREMVAALPGDLFAPNVILSGLAIRRGCRIHETPVEHVGRRHGRSSLGSFNVLRPAALSLWQTIVQAKRHGPGPHRGRADTSRRPEA